MKPIAILPLSATLFFAPIAASAEDRVLLDEDFSSNVHGWVIAKDPVRNVALDKHRLIVESLTEKVEIRTIQHPAPTDDWMIETSLAFTKARGERAGAGLVLGQKDLSNTIAFEIDASGNFSFWTEANGVWANVTEWTQTPALHKGLNASNTLAVRKIGGQFFLDINGKNVERIKAIDLLGPWWGFIVADRQGIEATNLRIVGRGAQKSGVREVVVFDEKFEGNASNWSVINDGHRKLQFENKRLVHENDVENGDVRSIAARIHENEWRIDLTFTFARASQEKYAPNGLVFGVSDVFHMLSYVIDAKGDYCFESEKDSQWQNVTNWNHTAALSTGVGATNTLTVRKVGGEFLLDANGKNIERVKAIDFFGPYVGMYTWTSFRNEISKLRVVEYARDPGEKGLVETATAARSRRP
jgi:hypothetical protein